jgi:hypothetical protein
MSINIFIEKLVDKLRSTLSFFSVSFNEKLVEALKKENDELKALKKENDYLGQLEQYWEAEVFSLKEAAKADAKIIQDFREKEKTWKYKAENIVGGALDSPAGQPGTREKGPVFLDGSPMDRSERQAHIEWLVDMIFM